MAFCENCGAPVADDSKFCEACGAKITPLEETKPQPIKPMRPDYGQERPVSNGNKGGKKSKSPAGIIIAVLAVACIALVIFLMVGKKGGGGNGTSAHVEIPTKKPEQQETTKPAATKATEEQTKETKVAETTIAGSLIDLENGFETEAQTVPQTIAQTGGDVSQGMHEIGTVTGGTWTQLGSGTWIYEKDGRIIKDSWVDDGGVFYYVDEDGYMLTDGITPDGYYVGPDGAYVPGGSQQASSGNTSSSVQTGGSSSDLAAIANKLSTDKIAYATEFDWFLDIILGSGTGNGLVVTDPARASVIKDPAGLNGGWKAYMYSDDGTERYFNAGVLAEGEKFNLTTNWKYLWIPSSGQSVEEEGSDLFKGKFDAGSGSATAQSTYAQIDIEHFYVSTDGNAEYAYGTFYWISGEIDHFALMRFKE